MHGGEEVWWTALFLSLSLLLALTLSLSLLVRMLVYVCALFKSQLSSSQTGAEADLGPAFLLLTHEENVAKQL